MKVIILNGSPKAHGNTATALHEVEWTLQQQGIGTEWIHVGHLQIHGCIACNKCCAELFVNRPSVCTVNIEAGAERFAALAAAATPRNVMVVGGGMAGMEHGQGRGAPGLRTRISSIYTPESRVSLPSGGAPGTWRPEPWLEMPGRERGS